MFLKCRRKLEFPRKDACKNGENTQTSNWDVPTEIPTPISWLWHHTFLCWLDGRNHMVLLGRSELFDAHFDGVTKHVSWSARIRYCDEVQVDSDANNGRQWHKKKRCTGWKLPRQTWGVVTCGNRPLWRKRAVNLLSILGTWKTTFSYLGLTRSWLQSKPNLITL